VSGDGAAATAARGADAERFCGTTPEPSLNRLAELARRLLGAESSQVSLLTDVQTIGGGAGLAAPAVGTTGPLEDSLCTVTVRLAGPLLVTDAASDERVRLLPPVSSGAVSAYLGVPLVTERGESVGALCVFDSQPRSWSDGDVELLQELAQSVVAELELAALAAEYRRSLERWELAGDAAGVGSFDWDLRTGELLWDDRLLRMFGYTPTDFTGRIEDFQRRVHPDDESRVGAALEHALATCGSFDAEYRVSLPGGETRWVAGRGRVLADESGRPVRMVGAAHDTTQVHEGEARVARVLESMTAAFFSLDQEWRFTYVNAEAERVLGRSRDELLGGNVWELFPLAVGTDFEHHYRKAMETGQQTGFEAYYPDPLDAWFEVRAWPSPDGLSVYFLDITARLEAQRLAERAMARSRLVADVTTALSATLDAEEAVARLAQALVPELAEWCLVTLVDDDGTLREVGWAHADPALHGATEQYSARRIQHLTPESYVMRAMRTRRPAILHADAAVRLAEFLDDAQGRTALMALAPASAALLPMIARGRTVGLLSLFNGASRKPYDDAEIATARDVAARAALALDNARLFQQQRRLAEELQRSLLTPPPEPDHMQVVVRYVPAAETAQVGGDWYDAFLQPDGATVLVIGDVVGHDTAAAAAMGQVRGLLRGIAFTTEQGPAHVLTRLDAAIEALQVGTNATAVVARLEQTPDERSRGITRMRWSNAGHPPPMTLTPSGEVRVLTAVEADLLLGLDPSSAREESHVVLDRGATVLLYTDGLVERRGQSLDEGLERLRTALAELADLSLDELCDQLLARLLPSSSEDDVALVAVRLHPQDQPRPAEAGPEVVPPEVPRVD
jgi:PAS domain S-box-containing protein